MEMFNKMEQGQSIFEVVVAVALISFVLIALVSMASLSISASTFARNQTQAARFAQQAAEWLRSEKDAGWSAFRAHAANPTWCLDSLTWLKPSSCAMSELISGTIFTRTLNLAVNSDGSVGATVNVSWVDSRGTHNVPVSVVFSQAGL
jgi:Tfp pilus assembly protein PilV